MKSIVAPARVGEAEVEGARLAGFGQLVGAVDFEVAGGDHLHEVDLGGEAVSERQGAVARAVVDDYPAGGRQRLRGEGARGRLEVASPRRRPG